MFPRPGLLCPAKRRQAPLGCAETPGSSQTTQSLPGTQRQPLPPRVTRCGGSRKQPPSTFVFPRPSLLNSAKRRPAPLGYAETPGSSQTTQSLPGTQRQPPLLRVGRCRRGRRQSPRTFVFPRPGLLYTVKRRPAPLGYAETPGSSQTTQSLPGTQRQPPWLRIRRWRRGRRQPPSTFVFPRPSLLNSAKRRPAPLGYAETPGSSLTTQSLPGTQRQHHQLRIGRWPIGNRKGELV